MALWTSPYQWDVSTSVVESHWHVFLKVNGTQLSFCPYSCCLERGFDGRSSSWHAGSWGKKKFYIGQEGVASCLQLPVGLGEGEMNCALLTCPAEFTLTQFPSHFHYTRSKDHGSGMYGQMVKLLTVMEQGPAVTHDNQNRPSLEASTWKKMKSDL